jgi:hypothetical protein
LLATISLQLDLRGDLHLGMPQRFRNPRRSQVTPETFTLYPIDDGMFPFWRRSVAFSRRCRHQRHFYPAFVHVSDIEAADCCM